MSQHCFVCFCIGDCSVLLWLFLLRMCVCTYVYIYIYMYMFVCACVRYFFGDVGVDMCALVKYCPCIRMYLHTPSKVMFTFMFFCSELDMCYPFPIRIGINVDFNWRIATYLRINDTSNAVLEVYKAGLLCYPLSCVWVHQPFIVSLVRHTHTRVRMQKQKHTLLCMCVYIYIHGKPETP